MGNFDGFNKDSFSIVIPCKRVDTDVLKCVAECEKLPNKKEILVVTDQECPGFPSAKRNWAMDRAMGEYLAFIDSDAYPTEHWLDNALTYLRMGFSGVCGAGMVPPQSPVREKATDLVLRLLPYSYRVYPQKPRIVSEFPTFNLIVRRDLAPRFQEYLTGEDTLFCRQMRGAIIYAPEVSIFHRRRPLLRGYWKQISTYGKHRGHLIRLALLGWLSTPFVYGFNFIKGFLRRSL